MSRAAIKTNTTSRIPRFFSLSFSASAVHLWVGVLHVSTNKILLPTSDFLSFVRVEKGNLPEL